MEQSARELIPQGMVAELSRAEATQYHHSSSLLKQLNFFALHPFNFSCVKPTRLPSFCFFSTYFSLSSTSYANCHLVPSSLSFLSDSLAAR
jgi:hypothetical protein